MTANKVSGVFPAQRHYCLAPRRLMALRVLLLCLYALFSANSFAQQPDSPPPDVPPGQEVRPPKQQNPQVRSASFASSGDSAAASIGGIQTPENTRVNAGGAATQSIPIVIPPGTAGIQPKLSFKDRKSVV